MQLDKAIRAIVTDQMQKEIINRGLATRSYAMDQIAVHRQMSHCESDVTKMANRLLVLEPAVKTLEKQVKKLFGKTTEKTSEKPDYTEKPDYNYMSQEEKDSADRLVESFTNQIPVGFTFTRAQKEYIANRLKESL